MATQKRDLPTKICPVCDLPFTWRKKWRNSWEEVIYCSEKCRRNRQSTSYMNAQPMTETTSQA